MYQMNVIKSAGISRNLETADETIDGTTNQSIGFVSSTFGPSGINMLSTIAYFLWIGSA